MRSLSMLVFAIALCMPGCHDSSAGFVGGSPGGVVHGNGNVVEEFRDVSGARSVNLQGVGQLYIRQGARAELRIRAEENLLEYLGSDVRGGELLIWKEAPTLINSQPIEYHLTVVDLERVVLSGAGPIQGLDLNTGALTLLLTGVGNVEFVNLNAPALVVDTSGVGRLTLSGTVQTQTLRLAGLGDYNGRDLDSADAEVLIANTSSATVRARDTLRATIHGSGSVYYIGNPVVYTSNSGSGSVVRIGG